MMSLPTQRNASPQTASRHSHSTSREAIKAFEEVSLQGAIRKEIRTYGKRVQLNAAAPPAKRQRVRDQRNTSTGQQPRKSEGTSTSLIKSGTIQSFFKPIPIPSSPPSTEAASDFSDSIESDFTPPSSPILILSQSPPLQRKITQRPRRRLKTRLLPTSHLKMSFQDHITGAWDDAVSMKSFGSSKSPSSSSSSGSSAIDPSTGVSPQTAPATGGGSSNHQTFLSVNNGGGSSSSGGQLVLNNSYGSPAYVECQDCSMNYDRTKKSDIEWHTKYHADYFLEKALKCGESSQQVVWKHPLNISHKIVCVDKKSSTNMRDLAMDVLELSRDTLGGLSYTEDTVFMDIDNPDVGATGKVPRYKVFIYLVRDVPVAVMLAERISEAGYYYEGETRYDLGGPWPALVSPPEGEETQAYVYKDDPQRAIMLVDRIWTKFDMRHTGIATRLIDSARDGAFIPRFAIPRHQIAFSWPTRQGVGFATSYQKHCFEEYPFLVGFDAAALIVENDKLVETGVTNF